MLSFDWAFVMNLLLVLINLGIIIFLLSWLLYKPVLGFLAQRKERIRSELAQAAENLRVSEEKKTQYDTKLAAIKTEREDILDAARRVAGEREAEIIVNANAEAGLIMERARREIDQEREKAKDEMRSQIIQVSAMMAERLMGSGMDVSTRDKLLNEAITELGDAEWRG